ncbi:50S ribosomal protein L13 [candidate division WWE3 bacterium RIFCSPHIGHO2_01_FULL_42_13]|uniref:Large ribosomal subunit protein uL13 n=1 Tax=candidate division WWE3 bacterium RIFCSPHIGHO2_01_FULL_42_13 TaxID=1802617 RepID=A0A1F4UR16_UNCKA|nr:MAG: 50S ribosomal protein L13 [candidate division WWE3 bacterium RIFCSPHIGHO2_01_FULL_42_13]
MNKTYAPNTKDIEGQWYFLNADGQVLGKLATNAASLLMGKNSASYTPGALSGNHVVVTNAEKIAVSGNKTDNKIYYRHSNYPGGLRQETLGEVMEKSPSKAIERAIKGMLPINKLRKKWMANLHVYADTNHPHTAQEKAK